MTPTMKTITSLQTVDSNLQSLVDAALEQSGGLLRLAPCWVPRSFLQPGRRLKLHPDDIYAYGLDRGGIDERWFGSTTPAANENRTPDEGLSYCVFDGKRFTLAAAIQERGAQIIGESIWNKYRRWPVYSKFFDNMGPIPHHMHQSAEFARLVGQEGKPESYYFPPQHNQVGNNFPYTFMGLEPGTTKDQVKKCLENWNLGDNGILDLSKAYRLKPGTGWLIGPGLLHAPGSLVTYEPQWGSDVFSMFQSLVEGREVPRALLVKDMPPEKHFDLDFIVSELVSAKELTLQPGVKCTIRDNGAYGLTVVEGRGKMNNLVLDSPNMIRFVEMTDDEVFCTESAARAGVIFENTSEVEDLVLLRYFGPGVNPEAPRIGRGK